jgi:hypothetical protein
MALVVLFSLLLWLEGEKCTIINLEMADRTHPMASPDPL